MTVGTVATLAAATDPAAALADKLEDAARKIRAGELVADQGVLVLRNRAGALMHLPQRLGVSATTTELLGMLAYAQLHLFHDEAVE